MFTHSEHANTKDPIREGSRWSEIIAALQDPEFKSADLVRLLLSEMSLVYRELQLTREHPSLAFRIKPLLAEIEALRSMVEIARSVPTLIAESDIVNLEGPKFGYIMGKLMEAIQASVREVFGDDLHTANVMRILIEKMEEMEKDLDRNLNNPQVLMEYAEQARRKREERRRNQTMYPPRYPTS